MARFPVSIRYRAYAKNVLGRPIFGSSLIGAAMLISAGLAFGGPGKHPDWGPEPPVAPYGMEPLPAQRTVVPLIFPIVGPCRWKDDYGAPRGKFLHTGIDIRAAKMTPIVAPFGGTLGLKRESFWIFGDSGWAMLGTHLNDDNLGKHDHAGSMDLMFAPGLVPGQHVHAGQFIGYVGMSGDATGPHLHFELYAPGPPPTASRIRDPFPSLKMAQVLSAPRATPPTERPDKGSTLIEGCVRKVEAVHHRMTMIVTAREFAGGETQAFTHIRYLRVQLPEPVVQAAGGWEAIDHLSATRMIAVTVPDAAKLDDEPASRISF